MINNLGVRFNFLNPFYKGREAKELEALFNRTGVKSHIIVKELAEKTNKSRKTYTKIK